MADNYYLGPVSGFTAAAKKIGEEETGISNWDRYLRGIEAQFATAAEQETARTSFDISKAYANYKKQQLALAENQRLFTGYKEEVSSGLRESYQTAYAQQQAQLASKLTSLGEQQAQVTGALESQFTQLGETARELQAEIFKYGAETGYGGLTPESNITELAKTSLVEGGLGWYTPSYDEQGREVLTQTAVGEKAIGEIIGSKDFADYLLKNNQKLYETLVQNPALYKEIVGGKGVVDYKASEKESDIEASKREQLQAKLDAENIQYSEALTKVYGENLENITADDAIDITNRFVETGGTYVSHIEDNINIMQDPRKLSFTDKYGVSWYSDQYKWRTTSDEHKGQLPSIINKLKSNPSGHKAGDIVYDSKSNTYYLIGDLRQWGTGYIVQFTKVDKK